MSTPLFYILAPFGLAFGLFAVYLIVSILLKDPARPFRMFKAPPLDKRREESGNTSQPFGYAQNPDPVEGDSEEGPADS